MIGTAYRTPIVPPDTGISDAAVYAVYPLAVIDGREATPYVLVTSCPLVGDTQVLPCGRDGVPLNLLLLGLVSSLDHAAALRVAGWELEEVIPRAVA